MNFLTKNSSQKELFTIKIRIKLNFLPYSFESDSYKKELISKKIEFNTSLNF